MRVALSPSIEASGKIVYHSSSAGKDPVAVSTDEIPANLSPSIGAGNAIVYYSSRSVSSMAAAAPSTRQLPAQMLASVDPSGYLVYYSKSPDLTRSSSPVSTIQAPDGILPSVDTLHRHIILFSSGAQGLPTPFSTLTVSERLSPSVVSSTDGQHVVLYPSMDEPNPGIVFSERFALSTEFLPPNASPSLIPPKTVLAFYAGQPHGSSVLVSSHTIPEGLSPSIGPSGEVVFYSMPTKPDADGRLGTPVPLSTESLSGQSASITTLSGDVVYYNKASDASRSGTRDMIPVSTQLPNPYGQGDGINTVPVATGSAASPLPFTAGSAASSHNGHKWSTARLFCKCGAGVLWILWAA